jgi:deazaflavin-dependent oxidoreductase (nitroreductase family)
VVLPKRLASFNRGVANHVTMPFAARLPGFGVVIHQGRRSGRTYRTPVILFRHDGVYTFVLVYGRGDWVGNVVQAGGAQVLTRGRIHMIVDPRIVEDPEHPDLPGAVRVILGLLHVDEELLAGEAV